MRKEREAEKGIRPKETKIKRASGKFHTPFYIA